MTTIPRTFTILPARYAKGMCALSFSGQDTHGYLFVLAHKQTSRYSHRELRSRKESPS